MALRDLLADAGVDVWVDVLLHQHETRTSRTGSDYEVLTVSDRSGVAEARDFKLRARASGHPPVLRARLRSEVYNDQVSLVVEDAEPSAVAAETMVTVSPHIEQHRAELRDALTSIPDDHPLRAVLVCAFDHDTVKRFLSWPAATKHHHNYPGGLAEHTLEVLGYARTLAAADDDPYDPHLLTAGCLLHDIGKVDEYAPPPLLKRSAAGELAYHLAHGHVRVGMAVAQARATGTPVGDRTLWLLTHLIEQSHGAYRLDQARQGLCKEARCLAAADDHSAKRVPSAREIAVHNVIGIR